MDHDLHVNTVHVRLILKNYRKLKIESIAIDNSIKNYGF